MMTFHQFSLRPKSIPAATSWYLADLSEARGNQDLFTKQSPQRLKVLRENAMIESAVSSNRIEGVTVDQARVRTILFGKLPLRDRNEEEVRGYRDPLKLIHEQGKKLSISEETILNLHRMYRGEIWDAGKYKEKDGDIIERYPNGRGRVRFKTVPAVKTQAFIKELIERWDEGKHNPWPYINFVLYTLKAAYREFEERVGQIKGPRGSKTELVEAAIQRFAKPFMLSDLERSCPGVSRDMMRKVLRDLQKSGLVECLGRGPGAPWQRKGITSKKG